MNFKKFFENLEGTDVALKVNGETRHDHDLNNEALFQLPLIALIILIMAGDRRKLKVSELGQFVGESIEASMLGFKGSSQQYGWSANLRVRTVIALRFLEHTNLTLINNRMGCIEITELGKRVLVQAMKAENNLSYNLLKISRSYRNIYINRKIDLELE